MIADLQQAVTDMIEQLQRSTQVATQLQDDTAVLQAQWRDSAATRFFQGQALQTLDELTALHDTVARYREPSQTLAEQALHIAELAQVQEQRVETFNATSEQIADTIAQLARDRQRLEQLQEQFYDSCRAAHSCLEQLRDLG
ncbi:hypothetical protein [Pseudidiomarina sediminum]|uniref:hypothetical protein n=1 Tax=Pseudidiomarina sediminum TaxID=431675 RepID=UPI001C96C77D|nr:hypothetical protein [Pseudidiomarina sediminum]MBY6063673.1 hypothetical protein [Pseudidiomarina sediminum]